MYDSFVFRGQSCEEYAAEAYWGEGYSIGANVRRSAYDLPQGGSVIIGEDAPAGRELTLTLIPTGSAGETPAWRRDVLTWLQGQRGQLSFRDDPNMERLCSFDKAAQGGGKISPLGGIQIGASFVSLARTRLESVAMGTTQNGTLQLTMPAETGWRAPIRVVLEPDGTLTALTLTTPDGSVVLEDVTINRTIEYYAGDAHGNPARLSVGGSADYSGFVSGQWGRLTLAQGEHLTAACTGCQCAVRLYARGWYID